MHIAIVALEGSLLSAISGLADMFWICNQASRNPPPGTAPYLAGSASPVFHTRIVSADGQSLRDPQGRWIPVDAAFDSETAYDAILVAGMALGDDGAPPCTGALAKAARWLYSRYQHGVLIGGACAGTFVLGEAGLLDRRRCTTTWWLHHVFKQRFPAACHVWGSAMEEQDGIITTGGPLSWVDLALQVIRRLAGHDLAKLAADISVADSVPLPQLVYAPRGFVNTANPLLLQAEQIIRHAHPGMTAGGLAQALHLSERTLHRRLKQLTGESPKAFITRVRIETACVLLGTPGIGIKQVASQCGYGDDTAFRRAFIQTMGLTPADYRRRMQSRHNEKANFHPAHDLPDQARGPDSG